MNNSRIAAALWFLSIVSFVIAALQRTATQREVQIGALNFNAIVFALLMGLCLMFSDVRMAEVLPQFTREQKSRFNIVHLLVDRPSSVFFAG